MILLERQKYHLLIEPLKKVRFNHFFARSVIEQHVSGRVYVDNINHPKSYYIAHPYGMSLLFGSWENQKFNSAFYGYALNHNQGRDRYEWMQASPDTWHEILADLFKDLLVKSSENTQQVESNVIEVNTRVNFKFNPEKYAVFKEKKDSKGVWIVPTSREIFSQMQGSVVPSNFWDNAEDFCEHGIGFSLFYNDRLATTAFSSFIHENYLELGLETIKEYRGKGFAKHTCAALIDYCLENNYEPIWSCSQENIGSYNLAIRLGFEPTIRLPYYRLSK